MDENKLIENLNSISSEMKAEGRAIFTDKEKIKKIGEMVEECINYMTEKGIAYRLQNIVMWKSLHKIRNLLIKGR